MDYTRNLARDPRSTDDVDVVRGLDFVAVASSPKIGDTEQLRLLQRAVADSLGGIAVCNRFGRVLFANDAMSDLFGFEAGELQKRDFRTIVPDVTFSSDAKSNVVSAWPPAMSLGESDDPSGAREIEGIKKDGSAVPIRIAVNRLASFSEPLFLASAIDLSEQRRLERRLSAVESDASFKALMADLAIRCAAASFDRIDDALHDVLREIGDAMTLDRCIAYLPDASPSPAFGATYSWSRALGPMPADDADAAESLPWMLSKARSGETVVAERLEELPSDVDRDSMQALGASSCVAVPLGLNGTRGVLVVDTVGERSWPPATVECLRLVAAVMSQSLARKRDRERLDSGLDELRRQRDQTLGENAVLRRDITSVQSDRTIASESVAIRRVLAQVHQVAPTTATVLLLGETGAGKEVFAQAIHNLSPRQRRPMIRVSCAAIPVALIESELFGRERGAFTGALSRQIGRFEAANGSTIFLDEIGDLPLEIQVKLLRVIQERTVERLGGNQSTKVDVRIIAATNRNLEHAVQNNTFREDLFYRLNVFPITIPPLRERVADIPSLVWTFIDEFSRGFGKKIDSISKESLAALQRYSWPGNVRELRNVIEREMIVATGPMLTVAPPRPVSSQRHPASSRLVDIEVEHIRAILDSCGWRVRGTGGAAERLGVKPTTLESRMARLGITRDSRKALSA